MREQNYQWGGSSGFEALYAGYRANLGEFRNIDYSWGCWTSSSYNLDNAIIRSSTTDVTTIHRALLGDKLSGEPVRCVKDTSECLLYGVHLNGSNVKCYGEMDGSITTVVNGSGSITYSWESGQDTKDISGLAAGWYKITVTDSVGCTISDSIMLSQPSPLKVEIITTLSCFGDSTGSISAIVTGGTPPYQYLWNNDALTDSIFGVGKGLYEVTVTDSNACNIVSSESVDEYPEIKAGQITGQTNVKPAEIYIYSVNQKPTSVFSWNVTGGNIVSGQGTNAVNVQWGPAGIGSVSVFETDENGCDGDPVSMDVAIVATGINPVYEGELRIYPNPINDKVIIEFPNPEHAEYKLILTDITGKIIRSVDNISEYRLELSLNGLNDGFYFIELKGLRNYKGKLVKD